MSKLAFWIAGFVLASAAGSAAANCSCQCIEGVPRTLCTTLDEAQANPKACGRGEQQVICASAPPVTDAMQRYQPPDGAVDCRDARLWDPHSSSYAVMAKVCDLDRGATAE